MIRMFELSECNCTRETQAHTHIHTHTHTYSITPAMTMATEIIYTLMEYFQQIRVLSCKFRNRETSMCLHLMTVSDWVVVPVFNPNLKSVVAWLQIGKLLTTKGNMITGNLVWSLFIKPHYRCGQIRLRSYWMGGGFKALGWVGVPWKLIRRIGESKSGRLVSCWARRHSVVTIRCPGKARTS